VDNKHQLVTVIGDTVLLDQVAQGQDVGDGSLAEPHMLVVLQWFANALVFA